jgi:hypothetical protein
LSKLFQFQGEGVSPTEAAQLIATVTGTGRELTWLEYISLVRFRYPSKVVEFSEQFYRPAKKHPWFSRGEINTFVYNFR